MSLKPFSGDQGAVFVPSRKQLPVRPKSGVSAAIGRVGPKSAFEGHWGRASAGDPGSDVPWILLGRQEGRLFRVWSIWAWNRFPFVQCSSETDMVLLLLCHNLLQWSPRYLSVRYSTPMLRCGWVRCLSYRGSGPALQVQSQRQSASATETRRARNIVISRACNIAIQPAGLAPYPIR